MITQSGLVIPQIAVPGSVSADGQMYGQTMPYDKRLNLLGSQIQNTPGFTDSVAMEVWRYMSEAEQSRRMDAKQAALYWTPMLLQEIYQFEIRHVGQFAALNEDYWQTMEMTMMSRQWSEEEEAVFAEQNLVSYKNNTMRRYALTALGEKMGSRTDWRARARRPDDDPYAEAANIAMNWAARRNQWKMQEQYVYRDGMVGGRGVAGVRRDPRDPFGNIKLERYRPQEFMWDIMTARDPRLKGTKYLWRGYYQSRADLIVEFPEWAEEIRSYSTPGMYATHMQLLDVLIKVKTPSPLGSDVPSTVFQPAAYAGWYDSLLVREFYRRHPVVKYRVVDGYRRKIVDFDSKDQAEAWGRATYNYWQAIFQANGIPILEPAVTQPKPVYVEAIERVVMAGNIILRVEPFGQDEFPYHHFMPEWIDGNITSFFGHGRDHQRIINRMFTRMDQAAGGVKGKVIVNTWALANEYDDSELDAILASDTAPLKVKVPPGMSLDDVFKITGQPSIGELPGMLLDIAFKGQSQMYGGLNSVGEEQSAQESGRAVLARQSAASVAMIPYQEEFSVFKEMVGKHLLENVQQLDPVILTAIIDDGPQSEKGTYAREIIAYGQQSLSEIDLELELTEIKASPSERDRRSSQMAFIFGQNPELLPIGLPLILKDLDIDDDIRKEMVATMQEDQAMKQQMEANQQAHQQDMERREMDLKHMDRWIRMQEMEIKRAPPPTIAATVKLEDTPELQATLANRLGMEADALGVAQAKAGAAIMRLEEEALQRQQYYRDTPKWAQPKAAAPAAQPPSKPRTPKSALARGNRKDK